MDNVESSGNCNLLQEDREASRKLSRDIDIIDFVTTTQKVATAYRCDAYLPCLFYITYK